MLLAARATEPLRGKDGQRAQIEGAKGEEEKQAGDDECGNEDHPVSVTRKMEEGQTEKIKSRGALTGENHSVGQGIPRPNFGHVGDSAPGSRCVRDSSGGSDRGGKGWEATRHQHW